MKSPSSQSTTPSPSMRLLPSFGLPPTLDPDEREVRKRTIERFLTSAGYSQLTRALRARLSYATYKAKHNVSRLSIVALEQRLASATHGTKRRATQMMMPPPTPSTAGGASQFYHTPFEQGPPAKRARLDSSSSNSTDGHIAPLSLNRKRQSQRYQSIEKEEVKAAAALTSMLRGRNSPRSETSTTHRRSLSRTSSAGSTSLSAPFSHQPPRAHTPPPDDNTAAELMLLLATSPSPARPTTVRDTKSNSNRISRVLFPGSQSIPSGQGSFGTSSEGSFSSSSQGSFYQGSFTSQRSFRPPPSSQSSAFQATSSLSSSQESSSSVMGNVGRTVLNPHGVSLPNTSTTSSTVPTFTINSAPSPQSDPFPQFQSSTVSSFSDATATPPFPMPGGLQLPVTPNPSFKISDFVNVSPSPGARMPASPAPSAPLGDQLKRHTSPTPSPKGGNTSNVTKGRASPRPAKTTGTRLTSSLGQRGQIQGSAGGSASTGASRVGAGRILFEEGLIGVGAPGRGGNGGLVGGTGMLEAGIDLAT